MAFVVDVTVRYKHSNSSLKDAAAEKVKKYQRLLLQIKDLANAAGIEFVGFPIGAWGKWHEKTSQLLLSFGLSKTRLGKIAWDLASTVLLSSVDIVHVC